MNQNIFFWSVDFQGSCIRQFHLKYLIEDSYIEKLMRNNPAKTVHLGHLEK